MGSPVRHASCSHATPCPSMSCSHPHLEVMRIARCGWPPCLHPARQSIIAVDEVVLGLNFLWVVDGCLVFSHELQGFIYSTIPAGWPCFFFLIFWGLSGGPPYYNHRKLHEKKSKARKLDRLVLSLGDFKGFLQFLSVVSM